MSGTFTESLETVDKNVDGPSQQNGDPLTCQVCGKKYKSQTWVQKHIREKHDQDQPVGFSSPSDLKDYVGGLDLEDGGREEESVSAGIDKTDQPVKIDFTITKEQTVTLLKSFNTFLDNIISLMVSLDIIYYSAMSKENVSAMANAIAVYIDHSGFQVTPGVFLMWNFMLIYGSVTLELPGEIRKERARIAEQAEKTDK